MIPEGKHYVEARRGDLVLRLFFEWRELMAPGRVEGFEAGCYHLGQPRLVALTPRPSDWNDLFHIDQPDAYRIDGQPAFVDELPDDAMQRAIEALPDLDAAKAVLESLLPPNTNP